MNNLDCLTNNWRFISPSGVSNSIYNPSGETTGNFAAVGAATVTRVTTYQKYGLYSYRVQTSANKQGLELTQATLTNQNYYATARVRGKLPNKWGFILKDSPYIQATLLETLGDGWFLYGVAFDAARSNGSTFLRIGQIGPGSGDFYIDGVQVEPTEPTTYCDGTQPGCAWDGTPHASTSTRSAQSRAGGKIQDLFNDYGFFVQKVVGAGAVTPTIGIDNYALLPGGELNSIKLEPRTFTLIGKFIADSEPELHDNRQALIIALSADTFPDNQPVKLRFTGARVQKEISAFYQGGLEGDLAAFYNNTFAPVEDSQWEDTNKFIEKATIQLSSPDPFWYEVGESAVSLDTEDSATIRKIAARLKSTGQWNPLGPPSASGTYIDVRAIAEDATYIYIGGNFQNWDGIAAADYIVRYNKQTGVYSALGSGLNNVVNALALAPNGDLYIGGQFTDAGGVAAADYLTVWNGTAFAAVGTPNTGAAAIVSVVTLCFDRIGNLYIGGNFLNWNNNANADHVVMWNGSSYSALSTGANSFVLAIVAGIDGLMYFGGSFVTFAGVACSQLASWDGTTATQLGSGVGATVNGLAIDQRNNLLYIVGAFTVIGGVAANYVATWNGATFSPLGSGLNADGYCVAVGPDGVAWIGGTFTAAGGVSLNQGFCAWNGFSFSHTGITLPTGSTLALLASRYVDAVIEQNYSVYIGINGSAATQTFGGSATATNGGSAPAFPKIVFNRSGGTTATIETVRNITTGQEILLNYGLQSGETLTIDLAPTQKSAISNFFGPRLDAILPNSDFGIWALQVGTNTLVSFVATTGSPAITGYLLYRRTFKSYD